MGVQGNGGITPAFIRGWAAEAKFKELLGAKVRKSNLAEDVHEHWDFNVKIDVKKIRGYDQFGESIHHWVEIRNIKGDDGWLYGDSDYIAFETKNMWIIVPTEELRVFVKFRSVKQFTKERVPYHYYQRDGRQDLMIMIPTLDLFLIEGSFTISKENQTL